MEAEAASLLVFPGQQDLCLHTWGLHIWACSASLLLFHFCQVCRPRCSSFCWIPGFSPSLSFKSQFRPFLCPGDPSLLLLFLLCCIPGSGHQHLERFFPCCSLLHQVPETLGLIFETRSLNCPNWAGICSLPASASQASAITGVHHHDRLTLNLLDFIPLMVRTESPLWVPDTAPKVTEPRGQTGAGLPKAQLRSIRPLTWGHLHWGHSSNLEGRGEAGTS